MTSSSTSTLDSQMPYTGERMVPTEADGGCFWEHIERYRWACAFAPGRRVLDIACGEGYGAAALRAAGAAEVIGVDVSAEACEHAKRKYGLDTRQGDAAAIPLPDQSFDLVVSFETVEHVPSPETFITECRRVLAPDGLLLISTPNRDVYRQRTASNPYHCSEMDVDEFTHLLSGHFRINTLYGQRIPERPIWQRRGFRRVMRAARENLLDGCYWNLSDTLRRSTTDLAQRPITWRDQVVNPWAVRRCSRRRLLCAEYLVVKAIRR